MASYIDPRWVENRIQAGLAAQHLEHGPVVVMINTVEVECQNPRISSSLWPKEVARASRSRSSLAPSEFCVGSGLVRAMPSQAPMLSEADIDISVDKYGKPYITDLSNASL